MRARKALLPMLATTLAALTAHGAHAASEIYRCVDNGRVMYTDRACGEQGEILAVGGLMTVAAHEPRDAAAAAPVPVVVGMSPQLVHQAMGRPLETVATLEGRVLVEYWLYRTAEGTLRIAFQEGRVTRIGIR